MPYEIKQVKTSTFYRWSAIRLFTVCPLDLQGRDNEAAS